ncbi:DeoR/GlpR family DNA-binding transcription regulator [Thalassospira sp. MCCC 1A01428]|uniref:DeoR/GlpR family DNA-binding transcription regulator n=1 Tax=Thalassospira sp. MCCC 1A01428 TaxID=1470575 RepID=UPI000A1F0976|nr:DeoR/GlpR family DNA-binding transcription regulator [Thalassospira sp. MCCC 1A01428]OSQ44780.1 DeoR family transcriptional regulator [Thalassospira sp. MCCC 1A01428]
MPRPVPIENRRDRIVSLVKSCGFMAVEELARRFDVSVQTIRTDLRDLQEQGRIFRRHGKAGPAPVPDNTSYEKREVWNRDGKRALAAKLTSMIPEGCTIAIGTGTTAELAASSLARHRNLTVLTNNLHVVLTLQNAPGVTLRLSGGTIRTRDLDVIGADSAEFFGCYRADFGIVSVGGMSPDGDLMDFNMDEVRARRALVQCCDHAILLVDDRKMGRKALCRDGHASDFDTVILNAAPSDILQTRLVQNRTSLIVAS